FSVSLLFFLLLLIFFLLIPPPLCSTLFPYTTLFRSITFTGHALECRINAEMPEKNFMPSSGTFDFAHFPAGGLGIRVDSGIYAGYKLPPYYDSMVAKLITHGDNRPQAINSMLCAVSEMTIKDVSRIEQFQ